MAFSKLVATLFFFTFAMTAAILQPSEARPEQQVLKQAPQAAPALPGMKSTTSPSPPGQPTECLTPLMGMLSCSDYLSNLTVLTPPGTCCDGLKSVISDAPVCLCHALNGDLNSFLPNPINPIHMITLPLFCGAILPLPTILSCNAIAVPPIMSPVAPVSPSPSP